MYRKKFRNYGMMRKDCFKFYFTKTFICANMSQKVNAVPDPSFSVPPLTTVAGSRVSRRRVKIPSNNITAVYTPSNVSSGSSSIVFDIADNESFLDMDKSMLSFDFIPFFIAGSQSDNTQSRLYPIHPIGFDGSSQSLMATVRIGNSQGLIIEELQAYATFSHIMESYTQSENQQENSLYDFETNALQIANRGNVRGAPESSKLLHSHVKRKMFLRFKNSSFLKSCRMIPLFLMRNGIRIQVDLQDSYKLFTRKFKPDWQGPAFAHKYVNSTNQVTDESLLGVGSDAATRTHMTAMDWYFVKNSTVLGIVIKKESRLAQLLNLRQLSGAAQFYYSRDALGVTANAQLKHAHDLVLPLKVVYTDEFGVDKVWIQAPFALKRGAWIEYAPSATPANFAPLNLATANDAAQLVHEMYSSVNINAGLTALTQGQEEVYYMEAVSAIDGFSEIFASQTTAPFNNAVNYIPFIPYARFQPRIYVDVNDIAVYVPNGTSYTHNQYLETNGTGTSNIVGAKTVNTSDTFGSQLRYANRAILDINTAWSYNILNAEMLCDFVKPSSEVFLQFQQAFQAPAGIPYAFKRVLYKTAVLQPTEGFAQVPLPVSVRSLRGVLVVLSDTYANASAAGDNTRKHFPAISSLMKRGLSRAQLVIGGQNYPSYDLNLTELGLEQIPELECLFNVSGLGGFNPCFDLTELYSSTNYAIGMGKNSNTSAFSGLWTDSINVTNGNMGVQEYHDTSKFVLGLSTMKKDGDFVTGVDTSQSGSVYLNLQFKLNKDVANGYQGDFGGRSGRQIFLQCFAICDAVFTLQNDANLVRY